nr:hypothetical protein [Tanacetum cinerariifolium]
SVSILKGKGVDLLDCCKRKIEDGQNTSFWTDIWDGDNSLKDTFTIVYSLKTEKFATVAVKKAQGNCTISLRRAPRRGVQSEQWTTMQHMLSSVSLSPMEDRWMWTVDGTGSFTVKFARDGMGNLPGGVS